MHRNKAKPGRFSLALLPCHSVDNHYQKHSNSSIDFQAFVDEIKNGAWFYLANWMAFWPQEDNYFFQDEFARLPGYETQNLRINKGYPEELQRKYDHSDLSRVVWPYKSE